MILRFAPFLTVALIALAGAPTAWSAPKYGPNAVPLSRQTNTEYFKRNPAPDFWTLIPYYLPQPTGKACSAANLALVLNGARSQMSLQSDQKLLTVPDFVKNYTDPAYETAVLGEGKPDRAQLTNRNIAKLLRQAAEKLAIKNDKTLIEVVNVDLKDIEKSRAAFTRSLIENEKSADDYMIISFMQGVLTGDPEGGSHVATIGAYDAKKRLVLILDPDREWYEPYWAPLDVVFDSIRDPRSDGISPGWIHFRVR